MDEHKCCGGCGEPVPPFSLWVMVWHFLATAAHTTAVVSVIKAVVYSYIDKDPFGCLVVAGIAYLAAIYYDGRLYEE